MSFKAVELQIAVPRTSEAGRYQNEYQQRPMLDQQMIAEQTAKEAQASSQRSTAVDETADAAVRDGQSHQGERHGGTLARDVEETQEQQPKLAEHPFKGKHIDLSF